MADSMTNCQHGFIKGRSCTTQLLETLDELTRIIDEGSPADVIYLDLAKAFDTVPHQRLITKLQSYGIVGDVIGWITDFLTNRKQQVCIGNVTSSWKPVTSGIPQGSVLGPVLFICYVNDMPLNIHSNIKIFADDTKLFSKIDSKSDSENLQQDLTNLEAWTNIWQLRFNATKCKVMHIGNKNQHYTYHMTENGETVELEPTKCEKDLGVYVDDQLDFSQHVQTTANKANKILGIIRRTFHYLDKHMLVTLFKSLVRPHLEYGNVAWSPFYKKDVLTLEKVQRRATKLLPFLADRSYEDRLQSLKLPSLVYRRLRGDLIEVYKYTHDIYKVDSNSLLPPNENRETRGNSYKLKKERFRLDVRKRFFSNRILNYWNALPEEAVTASSLNVFKNQVDKVYREYKYSAEYPIPVVRTPRITVTANRPLEQNVENCERP